MVTCQVTLGCMNRPWTTYPFEWALDGIREAGFQHFALLRHGGKHGPLHRGDVYL